MLWWYYLCFPVVVLALLIKFTGVAGNVKEKQGPLRASGGRTLRFADSFEEDQSVVVQRPVRGTASLSTGRRAARQAAAASPEAESKRNV